MVHAPRGSGKTSLITAAVTRARLAGETAVWLDLLQDGIRQPETPADLLAVDSVDPTDAAHVETLRTVAAAARAGRFSRIVIASRSATLLDAQRFPWLPVTTAVGPAELRLSPTSIRDLATHDGLELSDEAVELIVDESDGWLWAARFAVGAAHAARHAPCSELRGEIRRRIRLAVLDDLTEEQRHLFSTVDSIDREILSTIGIASPDSWLAEAESAGWLARDAAAPIYSVPRALKTALRDAEDPAPERLAETRGRLIDGLRAASRYSEMIDVALASDDAALVGRALQHSRLAGRFSDLYRVGNALAHKDFKWFGTQVDVVAVVAMLAAGSTRQYSNWLSFADKLVQTDPSSLASPSDRLHLLTLRLMAWRSLGDLDQAVRSAELVVQAWQRSANPNAAAAAGRATGFDYAAIVFALNNERRRPLVTAHEAISAARTHGDTALIVDTTSTLGTIHALHGDLVQAQSAFESVAEAPHAASSQRVFMQIGRAVLASERGDHARARRAADIALEAGFESDHWWLAHYASATVDRQAGATNTSRAYADAISRGLDRGLPVSAPVFQRIRFTELLVLDGRLTRAAASITLLPDECQHGRILTAVIEIARANWEAAQRTARLQLIDAPPRMTALRGLVLATAAAALGRAESASVHLTDTSERMRDWGLGSPLEFFPDAARGILVDAAAGIDAELRTFLSEQLRRYPALTVRKGALASLSDREQQVLERLRTGSTFPAIAEGLGIGVNTVKTLVRRIYRKLEASSRAEAVDRALDAGLLDGDSL